MKKFLILGAVLAGSLSFSPAAFAVVVSGTLASANAVQTFSIPLALNDTLTVSTTSYATGGFDPMLTLYNGSGTQVAFNDDSALNPNDSLIVFTVTGVSPGVAGTYTLALTQFGNSPLGTLAQGFSGNAGTGFGGRTANWTVVYTITNPGGTGVPDSGWTIGMLSVGLAVLAGLRRRFLG
jgi:hypothetical protein